MKNLAQIIENEIPKFELALQNWQWAPLFKKQTQGNLPWEFDASVRYSLNSGGKRFRPLVAFAMAEALQINTDAVVSWALACEAIHTYSLVHDDLPCMDNDDFRRGQPTNHKKYSEDTALLAGDSLLTSAFEILASNYQATPKVGLNLVKLLSTAAGSSGMVGGQFLDLQIDHLSLTETDLKLIHRLKTGALIAAAGTGVGIIAESSQQSLIEQYSWGLGFAFQLADDFLDFDPNKIEKTNLVQFIGPAAGKALLEDTTTQLVELASEISNNSTALIELAKMNSTRLK